MRSYRISCRSSLALALMIAVAGPLMADWPEDGLPVCTQPDDQRFPDVVSASDGTAIIVWDDRRLGTVWSVYAQKVDPDGNALWATDGVSMTVAADDGYAPHVLPDGAGGAFVGWRTTAAEIFLQRVDGDGNLLWGAQGVFLGNADAFTNLPMLVTDGAGGVIASWIYLEEIYVQRLDGNGDPVWVSPTVFNEWYNGVSLRSAVSDGSNGVILAFGWVFNNPDACVQRVNGLGQLLWSETENPNGVALVNMSGRWDAGEIVSDGQGGVFAPVSNAVGVRVQHVNSAGTLLWGEDGYEICPDCHYHDDLRPVVATADGAGGMIFAWPDSRNISTNDVDVYAQRVAPDGTMLWGVDSTGVPVTSEPEYQGNPSIVADATGRSVVVWEDSRNMQFADLYAQRLDANGNRESAEDLAVCTAVDVQDEPALALLEGPQTWIAAWMDHRSDGGDIYANGMFGDGGGAPFSDFNDGTSLQGWTEWETFNGDLYNPGSGGNPASGGFLRVDDTMQGGGTLRVLAPDDFEGDLSGYAGISWDEYVYYCSQTEPQNPTFPILEGSDGTRYWEADRSLRSTDEWYARSVPFQEEYWERIESTGTATFQEVLQNVVELQMNMECNVNCTGAGRGSAGIDNVRYDDCFGDIDCDGVLDGVDNCPYVANPGQEDLPDLDGVGNVCDNCPDDFNPGQEDDDGDGAGNVCDGCPYGFNTDPGFALFLHQIHGRRYCSDDPAQSCAYDADCLSGSCLKAAFEWLEYAEYYYAVGEFVTASDISTYPGSVFGPMAGSFFTDDVDPFPGSGYWYLLKPDCPEGSWQNDEGTEPDRDVWLP